MLYLLQCDLVHRHNWNRYLLIQFQVKYFLQNLYCCTLIPMAPSLHGIPNQKNIVEKVTMFERFVHNTHIRGCGGWVSMSVKCQTFSHFREVSSSEDTSRTDQSACPQQQHPPRWKKTKHFQRWSASIKFQRKRSHYRKFAEIVPEKSPTWRA